MKFWLPRLLKKKDTQVVTEKMVLQSVVPVEMVVSEHPGLRRDTTVSKALPDNLHVDAKWEPMDRFKIVDLLLPRPDQDHCGDVFTVEVKVNVLVQNGTATRRRQPNREMAELIGLLFEIVLRAVAKTYPLQPSCGEDISTARLKLLGSKTQKWPSLTAMPQDLAQEVMSRGRRWRLRL